MRETDVDCYVCFATYQGWQNVFYLSNHWDLIACWLLFPLEGEPVLFTGMYPHLENAKRFSIVPDVRFGGVENIALIAKELQRRGLDGATIGLVEPDSYRIPGIPHGTMANLRELLPRVTFMPCTAVVEEIRRRKSLEEQDLLRLSAGLTDETFQRVIDAVKPGVTEVDLAHVVMEAPGESVAILIGSTSMANPDLPYPAIRPSQRAISRGDVIMVEISKGCAGYAGQLHGTICVGPPTERYERIHATAYSAYQAISAILREGCTPDEVVEAGRVIPDNGYIAADPLTHGFGLGIEPGLFVGLKDQPAYWPNAEFTFPAGASLTIEPNPCEPDMKAGGTAGALVIVHDDCCEQPHQMSHAGIMVV